jgi:hypothetical protein
MYLVVNLMEKTPAFSSPYITFIFFLMLLSFSMDLLRKVGDQTFMPSNAHMQWNASLLTLALVWPSFMTWLLPEKLSMPVGFFFVLSVVVIFILAIAILISYVGKVIQGSGRGLPYWLGSYIFLMLVVLVSFALFPYPTWWGARGVALCMSFVYAGMSWPAIKAAWK